MCVTHDNAANIAHVGHKMNSEYEDLGCAAHNFHLAVLDAMGMKTQTTNHTIGRTINACSKLVGHFSHSSLASEELSKRCQSMQPDCAQRKLISYTRIRWNSICDMFQSVERLKWPITAVLGDEKVTKRSDAEYLELKTEQWKLISQLHPVLNEVKMASTLICSEKNTSISILLPVVYGLIMNKLQVLTDELPVISKFKTDLVTNLESRFNLNSPTIATGIAAISCVLDPRYKKLKFFNKENKIAAHNRVHELIAFNNQDDEVPIPKKARKDTTKNDLFHFTSDSDDESELCETEFARYLVDLVIDNEECPLAWWRSNEKRFPSVAKLAKKYLCVPATSTASERLFSAAGNILTKKRSRLLPETSRNVLFLHQNSGLL